MTIQLYTTTDRNNKINKNLVPVGSSISGTLRDSFDELHPVFEINMNSFSGANYLFCQDLGKYYFITRQYPNKGMMTIECQEDVLMTYKEQIMNLNCIVSRSSKLWNLYLQDSSRQTQQNQNTYILEFPESFENFSFVMATTGSYQNVQGGEG